MVREKKESISPILSQIIEWTFSELIKLWGSIINASYFNLLAICSHFTNRCLIWSEIGEKIQDKYRYEGKKLKKHFHCDCHRYHQKNHYNVYFVFGTTVLEANWYQSQVTERKKSSHLCHLFRNWEKAIFRLYIYSKFFKYTSYYHITFHHYQYSKQYLSDISQMLI